MQIEQGKGLNKPKSIPMRLRKQNPSLNRPSFDNDITSCRTVVALAYVIYSGIKTRVEASTTLVKATDQAAVLTVSVVHAETGAPGNELVLPGSAQRSRHANLCANQRYLKKCI